ASEDQLPTAGDPEKYPGVKDQETYKEGVLVGHRWYDAKSLKPAYPFGFGKSYTRFRLSKVKLRGRTVTARVRNVGKRAGSTVVQLYVGLPSTDALTQPPHQLRNYRKLTIRRSRSRRVRFTI